MLNYDVAVQAKHLW